MPANASNTLAVANALVGYLQAATYPNTSTPVYSSFVAPTGATIPGVQLGEFKDYIADLTANGAACCEVYGNQDDSELHAFGGNMWDTQTFYILSLVSLDNANQAEQAIFKVRDAIIVPFTQHVQLGGAGNVWDARYKPKSGKFIKIPRDGKHWYRAHVFEIIVKSEWYVPGFIQA